ncbi:hypothetical protein E2C01_019686 [Portunus trituberculatus]|uniref:Uncharacterized protein n=1 Tax=Portunus trituberculatus TaxID=210409 RepID=A0A5B7E024_PORTR|nr:hypothetical protein [Portunus trituberculatus]
MVQVEITSSIAHAWMGDTLAFERLITTIIEKYTGCSIEDKLKNVRQELDEENAFMIIITALDEVACKY